MAGTPTGLRPHPVASPAPIAAAACFLDPAKSRLGHSNPISKCILVFLPILSLNFGIHVGILSAETRPFTHKRAPSKANLRTMTRTCEDYLSHYIPPLKIPTYIYILIYLCVYLLMYVPRLEHGFFRFPTHICIYISRKDQQRPCKPHQGQPVFAYSVHSGPTGRFCYRNIDSMHV